LAEVVGALKREELGVHVVELQSGNAVFSSHGQKALIPASVMKAVTAAVALDVLGPEYNFKTELWVDGRQGSRIARLFMVGGGDPSLTIESLWLLIRGIRRQGVERIDELFFDTSRYEGRRERLGPRAYESAASALAFNFNSIGFEVCPGERGQNANVNIDPPEVMVELAGNIKTSTKSDSTFSIDPTPMGFQLGGSVFHKKDCSVVYRSVPDPLMYLEQAFRALAAGLGLQVGQVSQAAPTAKSELLFVHASKPLREIVQDMNHYSTNFIAEQIVFALGENEEGRLVRSLGLERIRSFLNKAGAPPEIAVADGSGLDRGNQLTASLLAGVMRTAALHEKYGIEFKNSFSVSRRNGTLRERQFDRGAFVRGKTGTLTGVSSLTGFVQDREGREYVFASLYNGGLPKYRVVELENRIVEVIYSYRP
jgi:D-alanyl-D-alanine carboxypeptidase/D-alanyl-D-alanine-endopeptidase (penicillin-binding protein 4)